MNRKLWIPIALLVLATPRFAAAIPDFPGELQERAEMPCAPQCTLCHRDNNGGIGTLQGAFIETLDEAQVLDIDDPASVQAAVDFLASNAIDSDGDGALDLDELKDGQNPSLKGDAPLCGPTYGCGATVAKSERTDWLAVTIALLASAGLVASWRSRHQRRAKRARH